MAPGARGRAMGGTPRACRDATSRCPPQEPLVARLLPHWTSQLQSSGMAGEMELRPRNRPRGQGGGFPLGQPGRPLPRGRAVSLGVSWGFFFCSKEGASVLLRRPPGPLSCSNTGERRQLRLQTSSSRFPQPSPLQQQTLRQRVWGCSRQARTLLEQLPAPPACSCLGHGGERAGKPGALPGVRWAGLPPAALLCGPSSPSSPKGLAAGTEEGRAMESHQLREKLNLSVPELGGDILNPATGAKPMPLLHREGDCMA